MAEQRHDTLPFTTGGFEVRLAAASEIDDAQAFRYRMFFEREHITAPPALSAARRDFDEYDVYCDHLVVVHEQKGLVGYYRLMRREKADQGCGFYSASEFDLSRLLENEGLLELGRLCIDPGSREFYVFGLLLRGLAAYVRMHKVRYLFGCASLHGTAPDAYARALLPLYEESLLPEHLRVLSLPGRGESILRAHETAPQLPLPRLLDFYLSVGGRVSDVLYVDTVMKCLDLLLVVDTESLLTKVDMHFRRRER